MARPVVKLSINLSKEVVDVIRGLAERRSTTMTEVIRKSLGTEKYLQDVVDKGGKVLVEDRRGRVRQIVL
jgi:predicted DNA-binding protein